MSALFLAACEAPDATPDFIENQVEKPSFKVQSPAETSKQATATLTKLAKREVVVTCATALKLIKDTVIYCSAQPEGFPETQQVRVTITAIDEKTFKPKLDLALLKNATPKIKEKAVNAWLKKDPKYKGLIADCGESSSAVGINLTFECVVTDRKGNKIPEKKQVIKGVLGVFLDDKGNLRLEAIQPDTQAPKESDAAPEITTPESTPTPESTTTPESTPTSPESDIAPPPADGPVATF